MMDLLLGAVQLGFALLLTVLFGLWFVSLSLAWSWAQQRSLSEKTSVSLAEVLAIASIEWGGFLTVAALQFLRRRPVYEAPPIRSQESPRSHYPIIFVPSLHLNSGLFQILQWRLHKHHYKSLWPFDWPSFLRNADLMEEELLRFIESRIQKTNSPELTIISFGTSGPIVAKTLKRAELQSLKVKWLAISAPIHPTAPLSFLQTERWKSSVTLLTESLQSPDAVIAGERDTLCYPVSVFERMPDLHLRDVGHFGALLHSSTTKFVLDFLK
jgi:hypothetical protein